jgi:hypothetical protein
MKIHPNKYLNGNSMEMRKSIAAGDLSDTL